MNKLIAAAVVALILIGLMLCGCAGRQGTPVSTVIVFGEDGNAVLVPGANTPAPTDSITWEPTGAVYSVNTGMGIPWGDIVPIAAVFALAAVGAGIWFKSKNLAFFIASIGVASILGIVAWELKWYILGACALGGICWALPSFVGTARLGLSKRTELPNPPSLKEPENEGNGL